MKFDRPSYPLHTAFIPVQTKGNQRLKSKTRKWPRTAKRTPSDATSYALHTLHTACPHTPHTPLALQGPSGPSLEARPRPPSGFFLVANFGRD